MPAQFPSSIFITSFIMISTSESQLSLASTNSGLGISSQETEISSGNSDINIGSVISYTFMVCEAV